MAYRAEFAEAVRRAIGARSMRSVAPGAGVTPAYIADMAQGRIPTRDRVLALAEATGADANELLIAAGYRPEPSGWNPDQAFNDGIRALALELGEPIQISTEEMPLSQATAPEITKALAAIRKRIQKRRRA